MCRHSGLRLTFSPETKTVRADVDLTAHRGGSGCVRGGDYSNPHEAFLTHSDICSTSALEHLAAAFSHLKPRLPGRRATADPSTSWLLPASLELPTKLFCYLP